MEPSCDVCQPQPNETETERDDRRALRAKWGCDRTSDKTGLEIECVVCPERQARQGCAACEGTGKIQILRCPHVLVQRVHLDICQGAELIELGLLPVAGGWADQSATFFDALVLVLREKAGYEKQRAKRERERQAREQKRAARGAGGGRVSASPRRANT